MVSFESEEIARLIPNPIQTLKYHLRCDITRLPNTQLPKNLFECVDVAVGAAHNSQFIWQLILQFGMRIVRIRNWISYGLRFAPRSTNPFHTECAGPNMCNKAKSRIPLVGRNFFSRFPPLEEKGYQFSLPPRFCLCASMFNLLFSFGSNSAEAYTHRNL